MILLVRKVAAIAASLFFPLLCGAAGQTPAARAPSASAAPPARTAVRALGRKHAAPKPSPAPATATQPPPVPLTPEQMPPVPPQVTYRNGLLTIVATNSTLDDILHAVSGRTGATVDAPAYLTGERVAARIGPGTPREVLSDLLRGPRFDYILLGSDEDPNAVRSIILTPNQSSPSAAMVQLQPRARPVTPPQEETEEEVVEDQQPQPEPAQRQSPRQRPFMPQQPPDQMGGQPGASPEGQQQVKTPEQLLQELRRLQDQQQNEPQR
jgi:hypothetical protein